MTRNYPEPRGCGDSDIPGDPINHYTGTQCPHCSYIIQSTDPEMEAYTVGNINGLPHIKCPKCKLCIGCSK